MPSRSYLHTRASSHSGSLYTLTPPLDVSLALVPFAQRSHWSLLPSYSVLVRLIGGVVVRILGRARGRRLDPVVLFLVPLVHLHRPLAVELGVDVIHPIELGLGGAARRPHRRLVVGEERAKVPEAHGAVGGAREQRVSKEGESAHRARVSRELV